MSIYDSIQGYHRYSYLGRIFYEPQDMAVENEDSGRLFYPCTTCAYVMDGYDKNPREQPHLFDGDVYCERCFIAGLLSHECVVDDLDEMIRVEKLAEVIPFVSAEAQALADLKPMIDFQWKEGCGR